MMQHLRYFVLGLLALLTAGGVQADDRPLTFGVFPYVSAVQLMESHAPLKRYLENKLGRPVELVTAPALPEFLTRTQEGGYDIVMTAPHFGRLAEQRGGYVPLVRTAHHVEGVFLVRQDSDIHSLKDLKGKTLMAAQPISIVYQLGIETLRKQGLIPGKSITIIDTRTHNNALAAPARNESDASITGQGLWAQASPDVKAKLREIATTPAVPGFMLLANKQLPNKSIKHIQKLLLDFGQTAEGKAYFEDTFLIGFEPIDRRTMRSLDPYTKILLQVDQQ